MGLNLDDAVWDATTFTKNRDRLLEGSVAREFLAQVVERRRQAGLVSDEHFTADGTLLEARASLKSFQPKEQKTAAGQQRHRRPHHATFGLRRQPEEAH